MIGFMVGLLGVAWRILMFTVVIELFITIIKSGKGTIRDIRDTFIMAIKIGVTKVQSWLFEKYAKYKEQEKQKQEAKPNSEAEKAEAEKAEGKVE